MSTLYSHHFQPSLSHLQLTSFLWDFWSVLALLLLYIQYPHSPPTDTHTHVCIFNLQNSFTGDCVYMCLKLRLNTWDWMIYQEALAWGRLIFLLQQTLTALSSSSRRGALGTLPYSHLYVDWYGHHSDLNIVEISWVSHLVVSTRHRLRTGILSSAPSNRSGYYFAMFPELEVQGWFCRCTSWALHPSPSLSAFSIVAERNFFCWGVGATLIFAYNDWCVEHRLKLCLFGNMTKSGSPLRAMYSLTFSNCLLPQCLSWFPSYCTGLKPSETASGYIQDIIATVVPLGMSCQSDHFVVPTFYV